jgi:hypothetical protein
MMAFAKHWQRDDLSDILVVIKAPKDSTGDAEHAVKRRRTEVEQNKHIVGSQDCLQGKADMIVVSTFPSHKVLLTSWSDKFEAQVGSLVYPSTGGLFHTLHADDTAAARLKQMAVLACNHLPSHICLGCVSQINFAGRQLQQQHAAQHLEIELEDASHLAAATAMFAAMYEVLGKPQL